MGGGRVRKEWDFRKELKETRTEGKERKRGLGAMEDPSGFQGVSTCRFMEVQPQRREGISRWPGCLREQAGFELKDQIFIDKLGDP